MTLLPLTKDDFEKIVADVTSKFSLPLNDDMRVMTVSYFHSLDRFVFSFDPEQLGAFLHKAVSNDMTYWIGQAIHKSRQAEAHTNGVDKQPEENKTTEQPTSLSVVEPTNH